MLVYAGIDEAGYGPLLGPLCVGCAVATIEGVDGHGTVTAPNLWAMLESAVCERPSDPRKRIAIADSKRLKGARDGASHPLRHLERGVLAAIAANTAATPRASIPATDSALFQQLGTTIDPRGDAPWYRGETTLPLAHDGDSLAIAANRLRVASRSAGVTLSLLRCSALDGSDFNERAAKTAKSDLNFEMAMCHLDAIWTAHGSLHPRVVIDRHGGRCHYRQPLETRFPGAAIEVVGETEAISRYRLTDDRGTLTVSFEVESESRHLPNALASMTAKFVRELFMERMNRFFTGQVSELKPTAGYIEDGRRYVEAISGTLAALGVPLGRLVRSR